MMADRKVGPRFKVIEANLSVFVLQYSPESVNSGCLTGKWAPGFELLSQTWSLGMLQYYFKVCEVMMANMKFGPRLRVI